LRKIESWFSKSDRTLTFDELFVRSKKWNDAHCKGPLDDYQISELVKQGIDYINKRNIFESTTSNIESENYSNQQTISLLKEGEDKLLDSQQILKKISGNTFIEFVIDAAKKTIKKEDSLVRLILYTSLSTYTKDPVNLWPHSSNK
jgi:hypothetical protein